MALLRRDPPREIAGVAVARVRDLASGDGDLPPSDVLALDLADGSAVLVRPSGTEPKIKVYFEVREPMDAAEPLRAAEARAMSRLASLRGELETYLVIR